MENVKEVVTEVATEVAKETRPRQLTFRCLNEQGIEVDTGDAVSLEIVNKSTLVKHTIVVANIQNARTLRHCLVYGLKQIAGDYHNTERGVIRDTSIKNLIASLTNAAGLPAKPMRTGLESILAACIPADMSPDVREQIMANYTAMIATKKASR